MELRHKFDLNLLLPKRQMIKGWVCVELDFYVKNFGRLDNDNMIKTILDSIVLKEYIEDDRKIIKLISTKYKSDKEKIKFKIYGM